MDHGELGLPDVTVNLDDPEGTILETTTTDANGNYQFSVSSSLISQESGFEIQVIFPNGDAATIENVTGPGIDSNIDDAGYSNLFSLNAGGSQTVNAGLVAQSIVSGKVWMDSNGDGILDNGESGLQGITVNFDDADGATLQTTTTDANGNYQFQTSPAELNQINSSGTSQFEIQVIIPSGDAATIPFASSTGIYSSINASGYTPVYTLPATGGMSNINGGLVTGNGPWASVGGEVYLDSNVNGFQDNGEPGLQAINVNVLDANGNIVDSTSTDANGDYSFFGLLPGTYVLQFIAPSGYAFSPQTTDNSAGPNGDTNPIALGAGQYDPHVNAALNGDAPIVYQTNIPILAENDSYTGIDFTADGYDPLGEPLTPVIVQQPSIGSLVFDASTGLYDYTAPTGYVGLDSFEFELSNGHAVSDVVTVQVLAYGQSLPPDQYQSFPLVVTDLFDGNGGLPLQSSVKQGQINDCWFVAAAAGESQQNPNQIKSIITDLGNGNYSVKFPGYQAEILGFHNDTHDYSSANGDWLKALEKGYGLMVLDTQAVLPLGKDFYQYINAGDTLSRAIEVITGDKAKSQTLSLTSLADVRSELNTAFANKKVVTACTEGGAENQKKAMQYGLYGDHAYTVVAYNAATDKVRLYNPHGGNPEFDNGTGGLTFLGATDPEQPPPPAKPNNNGYFWMSLSDFAKKFTEICYEQ